jgi:Kef-type K+ transport system membrane component KefB
MFPLSDPVMIFAVVMMIILVAPLIMHRMRIPGLIGLIVSGALVGPSALNLLERDKTIDLLGTVGLLYLLFSAGLSIDLNQFLKAKFRSAAFGVISFSLPFFASIFVGTYILGYSYLSSLLLGSVVGSHTLIAYPVARRLGITKNRSVTMSLGATIATDALALMVLAVVVAMNAGEVGPEFWARFLFLVTCFVIVVVFGLPIIGRWFFRNVQDQGNADFSFLLVVLFLASVLADLVGLAPIVGAFIAGLSMNRLVPETSSLMSRVQFVGDALFIPFFLLSVGMLVDFKVLFGGFDVWWTALWFLFLVVVFKVLAAFIAKVFFKHTKDEMMTIAGLTIPQAAATLAVSLIGFDIGLFDQTAINAIVILMLSTCLIGTLLVERFGQHVALNDKAFPSMEDDSPQRIMVPLANENTATFLMDVALMLRKSDSQEPIFPLTVAADGDDVMAQVATAEKLLSHAVIHAASVNVPVLPVTRVDMNVSQGVFRAIRERRITTVVLGWNGVVRPRQRILGSILDEIINGTEELLLVCRFTKLPLNTTSRVVVILPQYAERESGFLGAVLAIKQIASKLGAKLCLVVLDKAAESIKELIEEIKPSVDTDYLPLPKWSNLIKTLNKNILKNDLLILSSARYERISWNYDTDLLPRKITSRFRENNFIAIFPSEIDFEDMTHSASDLKKTLSTSRMLTYMDELDLYSSVKTLLSTNKDFTTHVQEKLAHELTFNLLESATILCSNTILLHRHVSYVRKPIIFIGKLDSVLNINGLDEDVKVLVILLSPIEGLSDRHLQLISQLARTLNRKEIMTKIEDASNPKEVYESFL